MVQSAARYVPGAVCLPQALAVQFLLSRRGIMTELKLGVAKCEGAMQGHAWLESEGKPVFGGTPQSLSGYRPLQRGRDKRWEQ
jgi:hypothetical protein